ncbi:unnamed protein product [Alopecurus aequalis]
MGVRELPWLSYQERVKTSHCQLLGSVLGSEEKAQAAIFYSYNKYINGFAATMEEEEAVEISKHPSVISVFPNRGHKLHTTRSWEFLGMEKDGRVRANSIWAKSKFGQGVIIGNLDTGGRSLTVPSGAGRGRHARTHVTNLIKSSCRAGVWPEAASFSDDGMGPVPARWRGVCHDQSSDAQVCCNRKLIGAQYFNKGYIASVGQANANPASTRDSDGHGTHTLSTAAGRFVPGANLFGYGNGTAKGGAPGAHVAAYKVCWLPVNGSECFDADIMAAFDEAIHDGVDVLSVSLGGAGEEYFNDGVAIGSFHAVRNGVTVVSSAGNSGPGAGTVSNTAPWLVTVGASTMDRDFPAYLVLGNKRRIKGQSLSPVTLPANKHYRLISSEEARAANATVAQAQLCIEGSLDKPKVEGKIVMCIRGKNGRVEKGETVHRSGGAAMVLANDEASGDEVIADAHVLPATHITFSEGLALLAYINSTRLASGYITVPTTELGTKPAPLMAAFSSQGPNTVTPQILKPPRPLQLRVRHIHVVPARRRHRRPPQSPPPGLEPRRDKSAIMTTARVQDNMKKPMRNSSFLRATPFNYGAGHVQPNRAADPGLVYDMGATDYLHFLCALGYNSSVIDAFMDKQPEDDDRPRSTPRYAACLVTPPKVEDLNYPSVTVPHLSPSGEPRIVTRRVRNVGAAPAAYEVRVNAPRGVSVSVRPRRLEFGAAGEEKAFAVTFRAKKGSFLPGEYVFGRMVWSDGAGRHRVRSPVVARVADHRTNKTRVSVA